MTAPTLGFPRLSMRLAVQDQLHVSTIRLHAMAMARAHGFGSESIERVGLVADEMAGNILRHAGTGDVILRMAGETGSGCVEILALDKGPGIGDIRRAMRNPETSDSDGPANGLPGVRKNADLFDIYSPPGRGTAVVAHVGDCTSDAACCACGESSRGRLGVVCIPVHGEQECGDSWAVETIAGRQVVLVVDGLGHGPEAAAAALAAVCIFRDKPDADPLAILRDMNAALHGTRGAAVSMTVLDPATRTSFFCGVGNVEARIVTLSANRHMLPQNGIVGHNMPRLQQCVETPWPADGRLVMHSDGISSRWRLDHYPGLLARHPALLAGVLFRDNARVRDDATVLVVRDHSVVAAA